MHVSDSRFKVMERSEKYICNASIRFLETLCELWPIKLRMIKADQAGEWGEVDVIKQEMAPIVQQAKRPLNEMLLWRLRAKELYEINDKVRKNENDKCSKDFVRFINNWCYTVDPRLPPIGLPAMLPFVMWPKQEEFLLWVHDAYECGREWLVEKSRACGATWLLVAYYSWHFAFHDEFIGGFGSRDKESVDKLDNPKSIFSKVRFLIYNLPDMMLPKSYRGKTINSPSHNDSYMQIYNPDRNSIIFGEGGDNIGAGLRASIYVIDEAALLLHPKMVDDSLSYTANCRGSISTIRGMNHFGEKRHSGRVRVFTFWYYQDPARYEHWRDNRRPPDDKCPYIEHELLEKGALVVNQELLIDYSRSVEDSFIPGEWVKAAVDFDIPAEGDRQSGFDVAAGGENNSSYAFRVGPVCNDPIEIYYDTPQEGLECALHYAKDDKSGLFVYDQDGVGESVWGHIKITERKLRFNLYGIHNNSHASERFLFTEGEKARDFFRNIRSENWWNVRERFRKTFEHRNGIKMYDYQELISIPNNTKLINQLSQPKRVFRTDKIGVEKKEEMRSRGVKSPDLADALIYAFADPDRDSIVVSDFNYREEQGNIIDFNIDHESPIGKQYVALVTTEDLMTYALCCWWLPKANNPLFRVYCEFVEPATEVKKLCDNIKLIMNEEIKPIREWVCNEEMLRSLESSKNSPWYLYRKEKVYLRKNYMHDYNTSILIVNKMFANKIIQIHPRCERLALQLANWRIEKGKPQQNLGFAMALCQIITRLRTNKEIKKEYVEPMWAPKKPYRDSIGHFGRTAKEEKLSPPLYQKLAEKQVKNYAKELQTQT